MELEECLYYEEKDPDIKIYCGDCLEILPLIPDKSIDLVCTDPPYLVSQDRVFTRKGNKEVSLVFEWDKRFKNVESYLREIFQTVQVGSEKLKDTGSFYMWIADRYNSFIRQFMIDSGLHYKNTIVWYKINPVPHFEKNNFCNSYEFCCFACKDSKKFTFNFGYQKDMHNVFIFPICGGHERTDHPSQKPLKLIKKIINISSNENDLILDYYLGSGTTLIACKELNRRGMGIEINKSYCAIAKNRLQNTMRTLI